MVIKQSQNYSVPKDADWIVGISIADNNGDFINPLPNSVTFKLYSGDTQIEITPRIVLSNSVVTISIPNSTATSAALDGAYKYIILWNDTRANKISLLSGWLLYNRQRYPSGNAFEPDDLYSHGWQQGLGSASLRVLPSNVVATINSIVSGGGGDNGLNGWSPQVIIKGGYWFLEAWVGGSAPLTEEQIFSTNKYFSVDGGFTSDIANAVSARGEQGEPGTPGRNGANGADGLNGWSRIVEIKDEYWIVKEWVGGTAPLTPEQEAEVGKYLAKDGGFTTDINLAAPSRGLKGDKGDPAGGGDNGLNGWSRLVEIKNEYWYFKEWIGGTAPLTPEQEAQVGKYLAKDGGFTDDINLAAPSRGLKGGKGDPGDQGADGIDGLNGWSRIVVIKDEHWIVKEWVGGTAPLTPEQEAEVGKYLAKDGGFTGDINLAAPSRGLKGDKGVPGDSATGGSTTAFYIEITASLEEYGGHRQFFVLNNRDADGNILPISSQLQAAGAEYGDLIRVIDSVLTITKPVSGQKISYETIANGILSGLRIDALWTDIEWVDKTTTKEDVAAFAREKEKTTIELYDTTKFDIQDLPYKSTGTYVGRTFTASGGTIDVDVPAGALFGKTISISVDDINVPNLSAYVKPVDVDFSSIKNRAFLTFFQNSKGYFANFEPGNSLPIGRSSSFVEQVQVEGFISNDNIPIGAAVFVSRVSNSGLGVDFRVIWTSYVSELIANGLMASSYNGARVSPGSNAYIVTNTFPNLNVLFNNNATWTQALFDRTENITTIQEMAPFFAAAGSTTSNILEDKTTNIPPGVRTFIDPARTPSIHHISDVAKVTSHEVTANANTYSFDVESSLYQNQRSGIITPEGLSSSNGIPFVVDNHVDGETTKKIYVKGDIPAFLESSPNFDVYFTSQTTSLPSIPDTERDAIYTSGNQFISGGEVDIRTNEGYHYYDDTNESTVPIKHFANERLYSHIRFGEDKVAYEKVSYAAESSRLLGDMAIIIGSESDGVGYNSVGGRTTGSLTRNSFSPNLIWALYLTISSTEGGVTYPPSISIQFDNDVDIVVGDHILMAVGGFNILAPVVFAGRINDATTDYRIIAELDKDPFVDPDGSLFFSATFTIYRPLDARVHIRGRVDIVDSILEFVNMQSDIPPTKKALGSIFDVFPSTLGTQRNATYAVSENSQFNITGISNAGSISIDLGLPLSQDHSNYFVRVGGYYYAVKGIVKGSNGEILSFFLRGTDQTVRAGVTENDTTNLTAAQLSSRGIVNGVTGLYFYYESSSENVVVALTPQQEASKISPFLPPVDIPITKGIPITTTFSSPTVILGAGNSYVLPVVGNILVSKIYYVIIMIRIASGGVVRQLTGTIANCQQFGTGSPLIQEDSRSLLYDFSVASSVGSPQSLIDVRILVDFNNEGTTTYKSPKLTNQSSVSVTPRTFYVIVSEAV